jgi:S-formylglutathione hydrolase FrmB
MGGHSEDNGGGVKAAASTSHDPWNFSKKAAVDFGSSSSKSSGKQQTDMWGSNQDDKKKSNDPWGSVFKNQQNFKDMHLF